MVNMLEDKHCFNVKLCDLILYCDKGHGVCNLFSSSSGETGRKEGRKLNVIKSWGIRKFFFLAIIV